jgi:hypothetical protein
MSDRSRAFTPHFGCAEGKGATYVNVDITFRCSVCDRLGQGWDADITAESFGRPAEFARVYVEIGLPSDWIFFGDTVLCDECREKAEDDKGGGI